MSDETNITNVLPKEYFPSSINKLQITNEERAKLFGARKITIYVRHRDFLATKWTTRNCDTNLSFIEMR